jgi:hypothetical protein
MWFTAMRDKKVFRSFLGTDLSKLVEAKILYEIFKKVFTEVLNSHQLIDFKSMLFLAGQITNNV